MTLQMRYSPNSLIKGANLGDSIGKFYRDYSWGCEELGLWLIRVLRTPSPFSHRGDTEAYDCNLTSYPQSLKTSNPKPLTLNPKMPSPKFPLWSPGRGVRAASAKRPPGFRWSLGSGFKV